MGWSFITQGPEIVSYLKGLGAQCLLDLKLHDIPNTVKSAMKVLSQLGVDMTNVHAAGGVEMMKAAREGLGKSSQIDRCHSAHINIGSPDAGFSKYPNQPARVCDSLC